MTKMPTMCNMCVIQICELKKKFSLLYQANCWRVWTEDWKVCAPLNVEEPFSGWKVKTTELQWKNQLYVKISAQSRYSNSSLTLLEHSASSIHLSVRSTTIKSPCETFSYKKSSSRESQTSCPVQTQLVKFKSNLSEENNFSDSHPVESSARLKVIK